MSAPISLPALPPGDHTPFQVGALAFRQALRNLEAVHDENMEAFGDCNADTFLPALHKEFFSLPNGEERAGFWRAFAIWLESVVDGCVLLADKWDVLGDLTRGPRGVIMSDSQHKRAGALVPFAAVPCSVVDAPGAGVGAECLCQERPCFWGQTSEQMADVLAGRRRCPGVVTLEDLILAEEGRTGGAA